MRAKELKQKDELCSEFPSFIQF